MTDKEFIVEIYRLAYGENAFSKDYITAHEEVLVQIKYIHEIAWKTFEFKDEIIATRKSRYIGK
jgi:hypothetical protein